jgi:hypothetical protein
MYHLADRFDGASKIRQAVRSPPDRDCIEKPEEISAGDLKAWLL